MAGRPVTKVPARLHGPTRVRARQAVAAAGRLCRWRFTMLALQP